jgi:hypothetical protein
MACTRFSILLSRGNDSKGASWFIAEFREGV